MISIDNGQIWKNNEHFAKVEMKLAPNSRHFLFRVVVFTHRLDFVKVTTWVKKQMLERYLKNEDYEETNYKFDMH